MAESTFHFNSDNVMDFLNDIARSLIKFPETLEEKTKVSREFKKVSKKANYIIYKYILSKFISNYF